jgi:hypothetical protein
LTAKPHLEPLRSALVRFEGVGLQLRQDFPAWFGSRSVRVMELLDEFAMIQPIDDPRSWELIDLELLKVNPNDLKPQRIRHRKVSSGQSRTSLSTEEP